MLFEVRVTLWLLCATQCRAARNPIREGESVIHVNPTSRVKERERHSQWTGSLRKPKTVKGPQSFWENKVLQILSVFNPECLLFCNSAWSDLNSPDSCRPEPWVPVVGYLSMETHSHRWGKPPRKDETLAQKQQQDDKVRMVRKHTGSRVDV